MTRALAALVLAVVIGTHSLTCLLDEVGDRLVERSITEPPPEYAARLLEVAVNRARTVEALTEKRITLQEAAERFRATTSPESWNGTDRYLRECFPGASEEERCCRWVMLHVRSQRRSPEVIAEVLRSCEAALRGAGLGESRPEGRALSEFPRYPY